MTIGQFVRPLDQQFVAAARLERRTRPTTVVSPQAGGPQIAVELGLDLPHRDAIVGRLVARLARHASQFGAARHCGNRQRVYKPCKVEGIESGGVLCAQKRRSREQPRGLNKLSSSDGQIACFRMKVKDRRNFEVFRRSSLKVNASSRLKLECGFSGGAG